MTLQVKKMGMLALLSLFMMGCGDPNAVKVVPVEGTILFADGKPLPKGTRLYFQPNAGNLGTATGITDETGTFRVTHHSGSRGAALGKYTVQLAAPEGEQNAFFKVVPKQYFDGGGILTAEVSEGMSPLKYVVKK